MDGNNFICETRSEKEVERSSRGWSKLKPEGKNNAQASIEDAEQRECSDGGLPATPSAEWFESAQLPVLSIRCKVMFLLQPL